MMDNKLDAALKVKNDMIILSNIFYLLTRPKVYLRLSFCLFICPMLFRRLTR